jgi:hypothetical protein
MAKSVVVGKGNPCPKCGVTMKRYEHEPNWFPKVGGYGFKYWDRCWPCGHIQHYAEAKVTHEGH